MTAPAAKASRRGLGKVLLLVCSCGIVLLAALGWYVTSDSFQRMIRGQLIAELERATGGRVEVGSFHTSPFRLRIEVLNITIHGRESASEIPYAHVDQLLAEVKVISLLERQFGFHSIILEHPVIHVIFYPDGTTNQPQPVVRLSGKNPIEQLFAFSITRLEVREGKLIWNDQTIPLDFQAQNISADMNYLFFSRRYEGRVLIGKADARIRDYRPFAWMAQAQFALSGQSLQIKSFSGHLGRSQLSGSGRIDNFKQPKITLTYDVNVDMGELAAIAHDHDVRRGTFQATGQGYWDLSKFSSAGKASIADFDGKFDSVSVTHASVSSPYNITSERLTLSKIEGRLFGGLVKGDVDVANWLVPPAISHQGSSHKLELEQQGTSRFQFNNVSVEDVIAGFGSRVPVLRRLNMAGDGDGDVQLRWKGEPQNASADLTLNVAPPRTMRPGKLPLTAHLRGTYEGAAEDLQLTEFDAATRSTQIHASGRLSSHAALKISVESSNVAELQPVIASLGYTKLPIFRQGNISFNGSAAGKLSAYSIYGVLKAEDFTVAFPSARKNAPQVSHWDSFRALLQFSPEVVSLRNAALKNGNANIDFDLSASLVDGRMLPQSPFSLRLDLQDADLQNLLQLTGYECPATGRADLTLRLSGTQADPHGEGAIVLRDADIYHQQIRRLNADLRFIRRQAEVNNIRLWFYGGTAKGGMLYDLHSRTFRLNLSGSSFDLSQFPQLANQRFPIQGRMAFNAEAGGTFQHPAIQASIQLNDVSAGNEGLGNVRLNAFTQNGELHLSAQSAIERSRFSLKGDVQLRGDFETIADAEFSNWQTNGLLAPYLKNRLTGPSSVTGKLHLQGSLLRPRDINVTGTLTNVSLSAVNVTLHNGAPVNFSIAQRVFRVDKLHMVGDETDLTAAGSLQLEAPYTMSWSAQGDANLRLIETLNHDFTSRGRVSVKATATGTLSQPSIDGQVEITRGSIAYINLPSALSEINGTLVFSQHEMKVQSLTARTGGGLVTLSGSANLYEHQFHFDLGARGQDVRLRYPPGVSSTADLQLRLEGDLARSTLSGDVRVTKLSVTPGFDFANYLARSEQTPVLVQANTFLSHVALAVHITTTPELQMQTSSVRLSGDADLRVRGTVQTPAVLGRADILEGEIYFNGAKYQLQRGDVVFLDPTSIVPVLDLQANTQIRDYDITLRVTGDARHPTVNFQSEPPLPSSDIIALLALGRTNATPGQQATGAAPLNQDVGSVVLAQAFNAAVSDRVQRLFGGSRIKIDPQGLSTETNLARGPALTIEQQVTGKLTLTYTTNVSQTSQQIIQAQYNISQNVSIVGIRDQNGVVSFDVKIRHRKK
ncbi:MAG TPA: translocation/assembly module TamB domain-containing protein [Terriglobales bacterium]|nr:translocation/assembly module TamB domain-containing protein [Terriglobales bacterium]